MRQDDSTVRKAEMPSVIQADRARAWPYRPACYAPDDRERWMDGCYDRAATVIQSFAAHRLQALESSPADGAGGAKAFTLGDRVEKVGGASWRGLIVGTYRTALTADGYAVESENEPGSVQIYPAKALRKALTPTETGEQLFRARGKSPPDDADVTERLIAAVDAWIEDPDSNAEQEIMDARAALRGLGGAEG